MTSLAKAPPPLSHLFCKLPLIFFMKPFLYIFLFFLAFAPAANAQKIFKAKYASQADIKVYIVNYESQADLLVYMVKYESQANKDGLWFSVKHESQADKTIFFVDYESQADLKIFFVDYQSQAGWRNKQKQQLLKF